MGIPQKSSTSYRKLDSESEEQQTHADQQVRYTTDVSSIRGCPIAGGGVAETDSSSKTNPCGSGFSNPPRDSEDTSRRKPLFVAQRHHGVGAHRSPRGNVARNEGHKRQHDGDAHERERVMRAGAKKLIRHQARQPER